MACTALRKSEISPAFGVLASTVIIGLAMVLSLAFLISHWMLVNSTVAGRFSFTSASISIGSRRLTPSSRMREVMACDASMSSTSGRRASLATSSEARRMPTTPPAMSSRSETTRTAAPRRAAFQRMRLRRSFLRRSARKSLSRISESSSPFWGMVKVPSNSPLRMRSPSTIAPARTPVTFSTGVSAARSARVAASRAMAASSVSASSATTIAAGNASPAFQASAVRRSSLRCTTMPSAAGRWPHRARNSGTT